jgi:hypothetical protein
MTFLLVIIAVIFVVFLVVGGLVLPLMGMIELRTQAPERRPERAEEKIAA